MPLSRMENTTFAMPSIIDSHDMGLRTVLQSRCPKENAYSTRRVFSGTGLELVTRQATVRYLYHSATAAPILSSSNFLVVFAE
ncbi:hypothetical protein TNCV_3707901 [Trichonephila clavipes]|nr:hypothetical protein TNCV_3707901 [Trichonephila clavipes]